MRGEGRKMVSKRLERILRQCFRRYGYLVGGRPLLFFMFPLIATFLLAPAVFVMKYDDDVILLFTPFNAPSRDELRIYNEFLTAKPLEPVKSGHFNRLPVDLNALNSTKSMAGNEILLRSDKNQSVHPTTFVVAMAYANRSNVMTPTAWREMKQFVDYIYHNFTCQVQELSGRGSEIRPRILRYNPDFCDENNFVQCAPLPKYVKTIETVLDSSQTSINSGGNSKMTLTYPVMYLGNRPVNWGQMIYSATVDKSSGRLISAKTVWFSFEFQYDPAKVGEPVAKQCMSQVAEFTLSYGADRGNTGDLRFYFHSDWFQNEQVSATKAKVFPFIPATVILVTIYIVVSSYYSLDPITGLVEALLGMLTIGLSMGLSFAVLFAFGVPFNFVVSMTPFLILCVGIDNDVLLMSSWRRPSVARLKPKDRLAEAFVDAGPSLMITSVNDILCFAVGCLSHSPAISQFCLFTGVSLAFRLFYQLTFFSGALAYTSKFSHSLRNFSDTVHGQCSLCWRSSKNMTSKRGPIYREPVKTFPLSSTETANFNSNPATAPVPREHCMHKFFRTTYSSFIGRRWVRMFVTLTFFIYLSLASIYASKIRINISLVKLVYDDSPSKDFYDLAEKYISTQIGTVVVTKAPDFRQPNNVKRFLQFVRSLENMEYSSKNKDTTNLWLRPYLDFLTHMADSESDFFDYLQQFFQVSQENARYANDLRFTYSKEGKLILESFRFTTYYENVRTWDDSAKLMLQWRRTCSNYSDYGAIVQDYFGRNTYLDQRLTLPHNILQTMAIASLMVALVTSLLMPDATSMFFICFSSFSVDLGVIGALNVWGSNLDPVTMTCLLMTIGFSVYYTARVCYCYQKASRCWGNGEKLSYALGSVGWPILQGGLGTWIGIAPLALVRGYIIKTFFRTIVLVVAIGLMHGLLFMPVMMTVFDYSHPPFRNYRKNKDKAWIKDS